MRRPSEAVAHHLKQLGIICAAMLVGVAIFGGVVWFLINRGGFALAGLAIQAMAMAWPRVDQLYPSGP